MGSTTIKVEDDRTDEIASGTVIHLDQPVFNDDTIPEPAFSEATNVDEARAQIEQTRANMSETIDALKEKLAPENLKAEAKETAKAAAQGLVEGVVETTRETVSHVVEATKEKVEHLTEAASVTAAHIGNAVKEAVGTTKENLKEATASTGSMAKGAGYMISDAVKNNPLPAAIVGGTLIYLFLNARKNGSSTVGNGSSAGENTWTSYAETHPTTEHQSALAEMRDKVGDVAGNVREKVGDMAGTVRDKVSDAASTVGEKVNDTMSAVKYKVSNVANDVGTQAQHQAARAKTVMEENPLMVGAAVLALGAAIGLMMPITEQENRLMGQTRDRLMDQANEKAGALAQQAGTVAQKTLDAINENAREILTTTKESARNAFDTVKSTANDAVQELKDNNSNMSAQNQPVGQFTI